MLPDSIRLRIAELRPRRLFRPRSNWIAEEDFDEGWDDELDDTDYLYLTGICSDFDAFR